MGSFLMRLLHPATQRWLEKGQIWAGNLRCMMLSLCFTAVSSSRRVASGRFISVIILLSSRLVRVGRFADAKDRNLLREPQENYQISLGQDMEMFPEPFIPANHIPRKFEGPTQHHQPDRKKVSVYNLFRKPSRAFCWTVRGLRLPECVCLLVLFFPKDIRYFSVYVFAARRQRGFVLDLVFGRSNLNN